MTAKILPFTPRAQGRERPADAASPRGAILLFTGVRYERLPDAPAKPTKHTRRRSRRALQAL